MTPEAVGFADNTVLTERVACGARSYPTQGTCMTTTFESLGVAAPLVAVLSERGISEPFAIQARTIADALAGACAL